MMVDIVSRSQWGARAPKSVKRIATPTSKLFLHHTADSNRGAQGVRNIQRFHMDSRGWSDIAYSFLVDPDGTVFEGRGAGVAGAHTQGHNSTAHGLCAMGNYQSVTPPDSLIVGLAALVRHGAAEGWWVDGITGGHRDVGTTSCPGDRLYPRIGDINRLATTRPEPDPEVPVNVPPLVKKEGDDRVWIVLGRTRSHLADAVWKLMDPRAASKIITLPANHAVWGLPVLEEQSGGGAHSHQVSGTAT